MCIRDSACTRLSRHCWKPKNSTGRSQNWSRPPAVTRATDPFAQHDDPITAQTPSIYGQTPTLLLANLEHELRLSRDSVRLGTADGEHEPDLQVSGRIGRPDPAALARRTTDGLHC